LRRGVQKEARARQTVEMTQRIVPGVAERGLMAIFQGGCRKRKGKGGGREARREAAQLF
jgi:hypothetical protein